MFSTRLIYAIKIREIWMSMVNSTYNTAEDRIDKLQQLKGRTKLKFHKNISTYYREMKEKKTKIFKPKFLLLKMLKVIVKFILKYY